MTERLDARPAERQGLTDHVVVCGLHGDGVRVVEQLRLAGVPVVVVDDSPDTRLLHVVAGLGVRESPRT